MNRSRRDFLKKTLGGATLMSLGPAVPALWARSARAAAAAHDRRDTVLVVLQLSGGNDGLNTVVPYADDEYGRKRKTLRLTGSEVHKIDDYLGFHPATQGFARLLNEGTSSVVQGVGYPNSDRTHPGGMRNWHTARPGELNCPTGWLGRAVDGYWEPGQRDLPGVFVGPIPRPFALSAERAVVPAIRGPEELTLRKTLSQNRLPSPRLRREGLGVRGSADADNPLAEMVRRSTVAANAASRQVEAAVRAAGPGADYPPYQLAETLAKVATLIRADVGIRIFLTELGGGGIGGFDNHANQRDNHAALLKQLSESVAAFIGDLARDQELDRVVLMTFSEFGRTLTENGRRGTGHGAAQPIFLAGGKLRGGLVGEHPSLSDLDQDAPKHHTDYRRLYATMLGPWLGLDVAAVLGERYEPLELFRA